MAASCDPALPLPVAERLRLGDDAVNGAPAGRLVVGADGDAAIVFPDEVAAYHNVLGVYLIGPGGEIQAPRIVFPAIEAADADPRFRFARPGGGPLHAGDTVHLRDLYAPELLTPGTAFGLFMVADGARTGLLKGRGALSFVDVRGGGPATISMARTTWLSG